MDPVRAYLFFSGFLGLIEADLAHLPRMTFTDKDIPVKRLPCAEHHVPVRLILGGASDTVTAAGRKHLISFAFENPQKAPEEKMLLWEACDGRSSPQGACNYNIMLLLERSEADRVFACGTNGRETACCDMSLSEQSPMCMPSENIRSITESIREFVIKEREPSALVESAGRSDLYITNSGSGQYVGIHKFGQNRVGPANHNKEQHYVGLVVSRRSDDPLQDRVYAFYNEKNKDTGPDGAMWTPFVTQVCMADTGGPKGTLQFTWTSQMRARLFCGDPDSRQRFSELVDVAIVHAERWQDTRVYALFRNEWSMSAMCVFTIRDVDHTFTTSPFKGDQRNRNRACVPDSTKLPLDTLAMIKTMSEMQQWVRPVRDCGPLLFKHHSYTHVAVDTLQRNSSDHHPVLFLSLNNGGIHKVITNQSQIFIIAEYRLFTKKTHVLSILLHPPSRKLYVNSRSELVQMDVADCGQYGDSCEECVLARDPYCGWDETRCSPVTRGTKQDVAQGDYRICKDQFVGKVFAPSADAHGNKGVVTVGLPSGSKYFLQCPVSSQYAQYTWYHNESSIPCSSREQPCLLLIDSMGRQQAGSYTCVSEERGYRRVLLNYHLELRGGAAGHRPKPLLWVALALAVLIQSLSL